MRRLTFALLGMTALVLAACAFGPGQRAVFRDTKAGIYSNAVTDPARIMGDWRQVATFAGSPRPGCAAGAARFSPAAGGGMMADLTLCLDGQVIRFAGPVVVSGPGRLSLVGAKAPLDQPLWLLWVDTDVRTVIFGAPSGEFGFVLDRKARLPADRARAAREVLDFNGYDISALRSF